MSEEGQDRELLQQPWVPVFLGGMRLLAKSSFGDAEYWLLLSDMQNMWEEKVDTSVIQDRAQELNKRLRAPVDAFFSHLCTVARPLLAGEVSSELEDNREPPVISVHSRPERLTLQLKSELAGVPFYWEFRCVQSSVPVVCSQLVRPLLAVSRVLQKQVMELAAQLSRKDVEIQDYRESGAVLSRERLQTEEFDLHRYRETFVTQVLPKVCAVQDCFGFDATLQDLYAAVTAQETKHQQKGLVIRPGESFVPDNRVCDSHHPEDHTPGKKRPGSPVKQEEPPDSTQEDSGKSSGQEEDLRPSSLQEPQSEQTVPLSQATVNRGPSRPKKKKAVGLFR
uniref:Non-homologous end-joining factor 1 n=2 Tax=Scleropages formosus TaxID=113540 RepID=A0A8C9RVD6_SCLFO